MLEADPDDEEDDEDEDEDDPDDEEDDAAEPPCAHPLSTRTNATVNAAAPCDNLWRECISRSLRDGPGRFRESPSFSNRSVSPPYGGAGRHL
ncbi:hypothetical protein GCM10027449_10060 [Sinomonas notoginsengisoli]